MHFYQVNNPFFHQSYLKNSQNTESAQLWFLRYWYESLLGLQNSFEGLSKDFKAKQSNTSVWLLSPELGTCGIFCNFFTNKKWFFFAFFTKSIAYFCTSPILKRPLPVQINLIKNSTIHFLLVKKLTRGTFLPEIMAFAMT